MPASNRRQWLASLLLSGAAAAAQAQPNSAAPLQVQDAWARATVTGQQASGVFMQLTAAQPLRLVGASTPLAAVVEVHEMKMDGDVMRMRAIESLELPAGQTVALQPGGHHIMLMQLGQNLDAGATIPLELILQDAQGKELRLPLEVPVRAMGKKTGAHHGHQHGH